MNSSRKVLIDAVGVPGQGGGAVVAELLRWLPAMRPDWHWGACLLRPAVRDYEIKAEVNMEIVEDSRDNHYISRVLWLKSDLPRLIKRWRPDVLLSLSNLLPALPGLNKGVLIHQSNIIPGLSRFEKKSLAVRLRHVLLRKVILGSARGADAVIVQTELMKNGLSALDCKLNGRVHIIPNGYRSELSQWPVRDSVRAMVQGEADGKLLTYVSYPRPHKNHGRLLQAWRQVHSRLPGWRLALTLSPAERYAGLGLDVGELFRLIRESGMSDSVLLLGNLNPAEVDFALRHSGALVFPSLAESFGLPLAEALHARCPIIASDLSFSREIAADAAIYFNPVSETDIAEKIRRVALDPELREQLRRRGEEREPLFNYQSIAEQYCRVLEKIGQ